MERSALLSSFDTYTAVAPAPPAAVVCRNCGRPADHLAERFCRPCAIERRDWTRDLVERGIDDLTNRGITSGLEFDGWLDVLRQYEHFATIEPEVAA